MCHRCHNSVRFQDYQSGFHNYNDRLFLTIPLCEYLLAGLAVNPTLDTIYIFQKTAYFNNYLSKPVFMHNNEYRPSHSLTGVNSQAMVYLLELVEYSISRCYSPKALISNWENFLFVFS